MGVEAERAGGGGGGGRGKTCIYTELIAHPY